MQDNKLNSQPLSISFSTSKSNGQTYRGISDSNSSSVSIHTTNSIYNPIQITHKSHNNSHQEPLTKLPFEPFEPLNILTTPIAFENETEIENSLSQSIISPPSLATQLNNTQFKYCNELNSYLMENINCHQVLKNLHNILLSNFTEIDFQINYNKLQMNGLIFMNSYNANFSINLYSEINNTRIEFRRTSGDALAAAKMWSQIKGFITQNQSENEYKNDFDLIQLDLPMPPMDMTMTMENINNDLELDSLIKALIENDLFIVDELNFLYESMENKNICNQILNHEILMKLLINESLLNKDICVQRIVLLILNKLIKCDNFMNNYKLFYNLNLLLNDQQMLVKKYVMELLENMIGFKWEINEIERKTMIKNIKKYENECYYKINYGIIKKINEKLMMN